jgi:hypothetical protein
LPSVGLLLLFTSKAKRFCPTVPETSHAHPAARPLAPTAPETSCEVPTMLGRKPCGWSDRTTTGSAGRRLKPKLRPTRYVAPPNE